MLIGKKGEALSAISRADETSITVRGRDLCNDLMGRMSFTEFFLLHLLGGAPTENQRFFLDAMLVGLAEHGMTPNVQAARMTYAAAPEALQGAVAAGLLGAGSVVLGAAENAGRLLARGVAEAAKSGEAEAVVARRIAQDLRDRRQAIPGFGHPQHKPEDPRAQRLLALADARKAAGKHTAFLRALAPIVDEIWQRHLPININGTIASIMLDLDFPLESLRGIPILARCAGLIGHLYEETQRPIGFLLAHHAEAAVRYDGD
ncbi:MAG: citryl-CoA lyase [Candidatus Eiseniibacteriota bacterium]